MKAQKKREALLQFDSTSSYLSIAQYLKLMGYEWQRSFASR
jgi:hypothetical protein